MSAPWVKEILDEAKIPYKDRRHPAAYTAQELAHEEHVSGHSVAKVVVAIADNKPLILVLPASRKVRLADVKECLLAKDVRLATEEEMQALFPDCELGAIPPLPHWKDKEVWMDQTMTENDGKILFQAGDHNDAIEMSYLDWFHLANPHVGAFSVPPGEREAAIEENNT